MYKPTQLPNAHSIPNACPLVYKPTLVYICVFEIIFTFSIRYSTAINTCKYSCKGITPFVSSCKKCHVHPNTSFSQLHRRNNYTLLKYTVPKCTKHWSQNSKPTLAGGRSDSKQRLYYSYQHWSRIESEIDKLLQQLILRQTFHDDKKMNQDLN